MKKPLLFICFLSIHLFGISQESMISEELQYLSSDALKGRENGSEELYQCAQWIAGKFKEAGLRSPDLAANYLQEIHLLRVESQSKSLILNNFSIPEDNFFVLGQFENLRLDDIGKTKLFVIGENDDMMAVFSQIQTVDSSYAVLIHPSQRNRYERLKKYFTNGNLELEDENQSFSLWVLTEENSIESISLNARNKIKRQSVYNVIGELPSAESNDRKWIFSAHYDHIGVIQGSGGDSIANGANDDASGVVAVLELARKFSRGEALDKSLLFVAFAGEELGLYGSKYLASTIDLNEIEAMLSFELIGIPNEDLGPQSAYITGYDLSYLPDQLMKNSLQSDFMFFPDPYPNLQLFKRSDNISFANYGIPAHSISTYNETDPDYHRVSDEFENMDIEHIEDLINAVYQATLAMLDLNYSPGIIDFKTKNDR